MTPRERIEAVLGLDASAQSASAVESTESSASTDDGMVDPAAYVETIRKRSGFAS